MKKTSAYPHYLILLAGLTFLASLFWYLKMSFSDTLIMYKFDLQVYTVAAQNVLSGDSIYQTGLFYYDRLFYFIYPPFAALFFVPLANLSLEDSKYISILTNIAALVSIAWICWGLLEHSWGRKRLVLTLFTSALLLWTEPVQGTLYYGQINLLLMLLVLAGFSMRRNSIWQGILIGVATSIKLTPVIFIAYLFLTQRVRAGIIAIGTCILAIIIGFLLLPDDSLRYWSELRYGAGLVDVGIKSSSLNGVLLRLINHTGTANVIWYIAASAVGILGMYLAVHNSKRGNELLGLLLCAITGLLISPFSWTHHWIWMILFIPLLLHISLQKRNSLGWVSILVLCVVLLSFRPGYHPFLGAISNALVNKNLLLFHLFDAITQNLYSLVGMIILGCSAFIVLFHNRYKTDPDLTNKIIEDSPI